MCCVFYIWSLPVLSPECSPIDPHPLCSSVSKTGCITSAEEDARTAPCVSQAFCSPWHNADHLLLIWGSLSSLQRFFLQTLCEWCKFLHGCGLWGCKHTPYTCKECVPRYSWKVLWVLMNVYLCSAKGVLYVSLVGCRYRVLYLFLSGSSGICFSPYCVGLKRN